MNNKVSCEPCCEPPSELVDVDNELKRYGYTLDETWKSISALREKLENVLIYRIGFTLNSFPKASGSVLGVSLYEKNQSLMALNTFISDLVEMVDVPK